mmetsp:Transcript_926/g.1250  ORF Transcript_926/g.1250 Transcript_926/m.1250 type:complete len:579 (-) Transcript_926:93-1829(-)
MTNLEQSMTDEVKYDALMPKLGIEIFINPNLVESYSCLNTTNGKHVPYPNEVYISLQSGQIICQNCRRKNEIIQPNLLKLINDTISNATVRCPNFIPDDEGAYQRTNNNGQGCHWSGKTIDLPDHFSECKYSPVKCLYCIFSGTKDQVSKHEEQCPKFRVKCQHCDKLILRKDQKLHESLDKCRGCGETFKKCLFKGHKRTCRYIDMKCSFNQYGCPVVGLTKQNMDQHMESNKTFHALLKNNWDLNQKMNDLMQTRNANNINSDGNRKLSRPNVYIKQYTKSQVSFIIENNNDNIYDYVVEYYVIPSHIYVSPIKPESPLVLLSKLNDEQKVPQPESVILCHNNISCDYQHCTIKRGIDNERYRYILKVRSRHGNILSPSRVLLIDWKGFDSQILTNVDAQNKLLNILNTQLKIYVKLKCLLNSKRHGFSANAFHKRCDGKGPTIFLVKNEINAIFGGFTSVKWGTNANGIKKSKKEMRDPTAFLFALKPTTNVYQVKPKCVDSAIKLCDSEIIMFGNTPTLRIGNDCNNPRNNICYGDKQFQFHSPDQLIGGTTKDKQINFQVLQYEVFQVRFNDV